VHAEEREVELLGLDATRDEGIEQGDVAAESQAVVGVRPRSMSLLLVGREQPAADGRAVRRLQHDEMPFGKTMNDRDSCGRTAAVVATWASSTAGDISRRSRATWRS
jgi:hypothetical protein